MELTTIDDVVTALDGIIVESRRQSSRAGYFPALYRRVTVAVAQGIEDGVFDDGKRMEAFDVIFAGRYIDAYQRYRAGKSVTGSWEVAFRAVEDPMPIVLQHLVFGMNAHINLDLGIAAATVAPGAKLPALRRDFDKINEILGSLVDEVEVRLARIWPWLAPIDWLAGGIDERFAGFSLGIARDHAWRFAEQLVDCDEVGRAELIERVDSWIEAFGMKLWNPNMLLLVPITMIRLGEIGSVQKVIDELS